jgi:hypothetical protein
VLLLDDYGFVDRPNLPKRLAAAHNDESNKGYTTQPNDALLVKTTESTKDHGRSRTSLPSMTLELGHVYAKYKPVVLGKTMSKIRRFA